MDLWCFCPSPYATIHPNQYLFFPCVFHVPPTYFSLSFPPLTLLLLPIFPPSVKHQWINMAFILSMICWMCIMLAIEGSAPLEAHFPSYFPSFIYFLSWFFFSLTHHSAIAPSFPISCKGLVVELCANPLYLTSSLALLVTITVFPFIYLVCPPLCLSYRLPPSLVSRQRCGSVERRTDTLALWIGLTQMIHHMIGPTEAHLPATLRSWNVLRCSQKQSKCHKSSKSSSSMNMLQQINHIWPETATVDITYKYTVSYLILTDSFLTND